MTQDTAPRDAAATAWEGPAWTILILAALCTRLYDLGARVMTHDESIHAFTSFQLFAQGLYRHDPAYHGPLIYHVNAAVYHLFGATDFTARLAPAAAGIAIVGALWLFRRYLGAAGAATAAGLVTITPTMLFYSRHIREDIYVALFTVLWVYGAFRYLEERKARWLYVLTVSMALSFITKESSSIFGAIIGGFFAVAAIRRPSSAAAANARDAAADLTVLMFTLVLPFAAGPVYVLLGWNPVDRTPGNERLFAGAGVVAALVAASAVAGWWQFPRRPRAGTDAAVTRWDWAKLMAFFWVIQVTMFTGLFTNPVGGLITGIAGSAGYWLGQHDVARGSQPWFYYFIIGGLYEFLAILAGGVAAVVLAWRMRHRAFDPVSTADLPLAAVVLPARRTFFLFTIWWALASWGAYAWAGERMPWLLTHQVLPLLLLAGWGVAQLSRSAGTDGPRRETFLIAAGMTLAVVLVAGLWRGAPFSGRDLAAAAATAGWWIRLVLLALTVSILAVWGRHAGRSRLIRGLAFGAVLVLGLVTLRASLQLAYVNYDLATEPLSYAQASPDIKRILRRIEALSDPTPAGSDLRIAYDDESSWPLLWYFRNYPNARTWGFQPEFAQSAPVILVGDKNIDALQPYVAQGYESQRYVLYWWPIQDYKTLTLANLWSSLQKAEFREYLWQVFSRRNYGIPLAQWPLRREIQMFVKTDLATRSAPSAWPGEARVPITSSASPEPQRILAGPFDGLPLRGPTSLTVASDGAWVIADGGNNRVLVLEADGSLRASVGQGQLKEPWGVAVNKADELFVADTWNGQIQVFDARGVFQRKWGRFGQHTDAEGVPGEEWLYGPRGLVFTDAGALIVADTGNKRLMIFDATGKTLGSVGPSSTPPEYFDEPVSLARDANGTVLVADAWNTRIVRLDSRLNTIASWRVPGWASRSAEDKPGLAVDDAGFVYASDPAEGRVFVFAPGGGLEATIRIPGADQLPARPTGLAVDLAQRKLLVLDHRGGRLLVFPLHRRVR